MAGDIESNMGAVLKALANQPKQSGMDTPMTGLQVQEATALDPGAINDAVELLDSNGLVERLQTLGTAPFTFLQVEITARGRYEFERTIKESQQARPAQVASGLPPSPVGSPFGFTDNDWDYVSERKSALDSLNVVLGYQFKSTYYDSALLASNVEAMFVTAVSAHNKLRGARQVALDFRPLAAGYGEHLFNEIARDIIAADIAVFEASDLNPNVMVGLGVALTWGIRVLPIKRVDRPAPPSDISGQTWADYQHDGEGFSAADHNDRLVRMIQRAVRKKGHP